MQLMLPHLEESNHAPVGILTTPCIIFSVILVTARQEPLLLKTFTNILSDIFLAAASNLFTSITALPSDFS